MRKWPLYFPMLELYLFRNTLKVNVFKALFEVILLKDNILRQIYDKCFIVSYDTAVKLNWLK